MAIMIPNNFYDHGSPGEKEVFVALSNLLSEEYIVFHSVRWIDNASRNRSQGEADFVIFHQLRGLIVIEVKSGIIECSGRQWLQINRTSGFSKQIVDPELQASESKYKFIELLKAAHLNCMVCHAVWFPSVDFKPQTLPPNYNPKMLLDKEALINPKNAIENAFEYWSQFSSIKTDLSNHQKDQVLKTLAPTFKLVPNPRKEFEKREVDFFRLTHEQARILDFLDYQEKATIAGIAGTGKTIIAIEKAKRLAANGDNVLFLCFNRLLKDYLKHTYNDESFEILTFDGLVFKYFPNSSFETARVNFIEKLFENEIVIDFKHIVIDEGQDFEDEWLEILELSTKGAFYIFYDPLQSVQNIGKREYFNRAATKLTLTTNCRNTEEIARTAYSLISMKGRTPILSEISGKRARLIEFENYSQLSMSINKLISDFIDSSKIPIHRVAILSLGSQLNNSISSLNLKFLSSENYLEGHICITTARKYKGLEADLVILIDLEWKDLKNEVDKMLFYTACARAKHELYICSMPIEEIQMNQIIRHIEPNTKRKGSRMFYKLFNLNKS